MSSISLEAFASRHPREAEAIRRLEALLLRNEPALLTLDQLASTVHPRSQDELAVILGEIAAVGLIDFRLQVRSPKTREPIAGFRRPSEIPTTLMDESTNTRFLVQPDDIRPVYGLHCAAG